jgi:hypothetical protein
MCQEKKGPGRAQHFLKLSIPCGSSKIRRSNIQKEFKVFYDDILHLAKEGQE